MSHVNYERLIALVKQHPALYDYSHPAHCNRDVTGRLWGQIAAELDTTDVHCKTKWSTLRSNFVREIRRIRPSEDGTVWPPQWPLFKPLMFLLPFLKTRGSTGVTSPEESALLPLDTYEPEDHDNEDNARELIQHKKPRVGGVPAEEDENDDKLFMLSLVPKMRQLSTVDNLNFRIEVQQLLLNKLQQSSRSSITETVPVMMNESQKENNFEEITVKIEDYGTADSLGGFQLENV